MSRLATSFTDDVGVNERLLDSQESEAEGNSQNHPHDLPASGRDTNPHGLTFWNGLALVLSIQIGSGIFTAPWQVSNHVTSPGAGLTVWLFAGMIVWTGAASFIELGTNLPYNGGAQEYLRYCYGDLYGCMFTWTWIMIRKAAAMAIISTVFAEYLCRSMFGTSEIPQSVSKLISIGGLALITAVNCMGVKRGVFIAGGFLVLKILTVLFIVVIGFTCALIRRGELRPPEKDASWFDTHPMDDGQGAWTTFGNWTSAVYGALFCYGGWETIGFVAGDLVNPRRDLPRVMNSAMFIVIMSFAFLNISLYANVPFLVIRSSSTPIIDFGRFTMSDVGGVVLSLLISISALGALNANVFATALLCVAASQRRYFPAILANLHVDKAADEPSYYDRVFQVFPNTFRQFMKKLAGMSAQRRLEQGVPIYAILMNFSFAAFYIVIGTFDSLVTFMGLCEYSFWFLAALGLFNLRKQNVDHTAYRTMTLNPIIFCTLSGSLIIRGLITNPLQGAAIGLLCSLCWTTYRFRDLGESSA